MCAEWGLVVATSVLAAATVGMVVAIFMAAYVPLRQMRSDSRRELIKSLMKEWTSEKLRNARKLLFHELGIGAFEDVNLPQSAEELKKKLKSIEKEDREAYGTLLLIPHYFEMVSVIVRPEKDTEEARDILKLYRSTTIFFYKLYEPWITERRETTRHPTLYEEFQKLYKLAKSDKR